MRTTVTLDDDVVAGVERLRRGRGWTRRGSASARDRVGWGRSSTSRTSRERSRSARGRRTASGRERRYGHGRPSENRAGQGRRERSYQPGTGATEDAGLRRVCSRPGGTYFRSRPLVRPLVTLDPKRPPGGGRTCGRPRGRVRCAFGGGRGGGGGGGG